METIIQFFSDKSAFVVGFIIALTIVVFFHELGHFLVARWCGVTVEAFSIGFGREIVGFTDRKGTRWKLCWIPLGGYVKFIDDENAASAPSRDTLNNMSAEQRAGAFQEQELWKRAAVVAAGPIASFLLGIVIFAGTFSLYGYKYAKPYVGEVLKDSAASEAGFKAGDLIISINNQKIESFADIKTVVQLTLNQPLKFVVERNGANIELISTPRISDTKDLLGNKQRLIGIKNSPKPEHFVSRDVNVFQAIGLSLDRTYEVIHRSLEFIGKLMFGQASVNQLSGPVGIAKASGEIFKLGIGPLIQWVAFLSIAIGFFNLFPIPLLDGGHLLFYAIEWIKGKPLSDTSQDIGFRIGMAILLSLMIFVTIIDVSRFFES